MNNNLKDIYKARKEEYLQDITLRLEEHVKQIFFVELREKRIDRIIGRAKTVESFIQKAKSDIYSDPLNEIQDQIGIRIITFFLSDVDRISDNINSYFRHIEEKFIEPKNATEFGYFGKHFILFIPSDVLFLEEEKRNCPKFFELQIKTLYQHAWSESNHDLGYKGKYTLDDLEKRKIAFTAAQSWGADMIFNELFISKLNNK